MCKEREIWMKKIKINEKLMTRIVSGGLSIVFVASGFALGKLDSKHNDSANRDAIVDEYLEDYIAKRLTLEKEIEKLQKQESELKNSETFDLNDLIVIEHTPVDGQPDLYILDECSNYGGGIYEEYRNGFNAWFRLHGYTEDHVHGFCPEYVHFSESKPLFDYLTKEELEKIAMAGGKVTTLDLDEILNRIRNEYKEQLSDKSYSRSLTNN